MISALLTAFGLLISFLGFAMFLGRPQDQIDVFVGLDIGYGDEKIAMAQIDRVADFVNLIILGSLDVTMNTENLTRVCDHMYQKGLSFIIYVGYGKDSEDAPPRGPEQDFFTEAIQRYGDQFLGVYLFDEVGGKLMDGGHSVDLTKANTYSEAAILYTNDVNFFVGKVSQYYAPASFPLYTSDYALYWYDYVAGYDVVFTEYVGNQSRQLATALCRGAAKSLNKEWGAMITWSQKPNDFFERPEDLYHDMMLAYQNGAKYIVVFNSPENFDFPAPYGTLTPEHFEKMKQFWDYAHATSSFQRHVADTAFVLPRDYGFGFRWPDDKIWGKWNADSLSATLWTYAHHLLDMHVMNLDVVFETKISNEPVDLPYRKLIFWNRTVVER